MASSEGFQFSARLRWELSANSLSELLERKRRAGDSVLDLTESNPTRAGLPYESERILDPLCERAGMVYEPAAAGLNSAREAVASEYASRGREVDPGLILLHSSTFIHPHQQLFNSLRSPLLLNVPLKDSVNFLVKLPLTPPAFNPF